MPPAAAVAREGPGTGSRQMLTPDPLPAPEKFSAVYIAARQPSHRTLSAVCCRRPDLHQGRRDADLRNLGAPIAAPALENLECLVLWRDEIWGQL